MNEKEYDKIRELSRGIETCKKYYVHLQDLLFMYPELHGMTVAEASSFLTHECERLDKELRESLNVELIDMT